MLLLTAHLSLSDSPGDSDQLGIQGLCCMACCRAVHFLTVLEPVVEPSAVCILGQAAAAGFSQVLSLHHLAAP